METANAGTAKPGSAQPFLNFQVSGVVFRAVPSPTPPNDYFWA
jgi:hypothetical protein